MRYDANLTSVDTLKLMYFINWHIWDFDSAGQQLN